MALGNWFQPKKNRWAVDRLHQSIQAQALRPDFYFEGGARDNFSGRFEVTCLHGTLVFRRLREAGQAGKALSQEVFDALFDGFDEALRDIRVSLLEADVDFKVVRQFVATVKEKAVGEVVRV